MDQPANPDFLAEITGALDWWREAGVDCDFVDEPREWLAPPEPAAGERPAPKRSGSPAAKAEAEVPVSAQLDPAVLPRDLTTFRQWWLGDPLLGRDGVGDRIPPSGPAGAKLMVVVEEPEGQDREALLSGPQGRLLDAMLSAVGTTRDDIYLASALPRYTPACDWSALAQSGLGRVLSHHVALVAPERLIVFGGNTLSLLGHESPQRAAVSRQLGQEGRSIPMLASWGLLALLKRPPAKQAWWRAWLEWTTA